MSNTDNLHRVSAPLIDLLAVGCLTFRRSCPTRDILSAHFLTKSVSSSKHSVSSKQLLFFHPIQVYKSYDCINHKTKTTLGGKMQVVSHYNLFRKNILYTKIAIVCRLRRYRLSSSNNILGIKIYQFNRFFCCNNLTCITNSYSCTTSRKKFDFLHKCYLFRESLGRSNNFRALLQQPRSAPSALFYFFGVVPKLFP